MQWGDQVEFLESIAERDGVEPQALQDQPEQNVTIDYYLNAFSILNPSRSFGPPMGAIPLTEYAAYMQMIPMLEDGETFVLIMRALDEEFMDFYKRKNKK